MCCAGNVPALLYPGANQLSQLCCRGCGVPIQGEMGKERENPISQHDAICFFLESDRWLNHEPWCNYSQICMPLIKGLGLLF